MLIHRVLFNEVSEIYNILFVNFAVSVFMWVRLKLNRAECIYSALNDYSFLLVVIKISPVLANLTDKEVKSVLNII